MTIAAKHFDPILGIDVHILLMPPAATPTPMPNPYVGIVFDPIDYIPWIGATVFINKLPRAQAGTAGLALVPHLPLGGPFQPPPPKSESEVFMGSSTVVVDGDAQSYLGLPALSCQSIGVPAPLRLKGKPARSLVLPTSLVLSIPMGAPVLIGGAPTISVTALGMRAAFAALGPLGRGLRKLQRGTGRIGTAMRAITRGAQRAGNALADGLRLGQRGRNRIDRAICTLTGHPVDVATGKVFTDKIDLELPGPIPFRWERVWYSTSTYRGPLGHGWHHSYDAALYVTDDVVLHRTPDGRLVSFPPLERGEEHFDLTERLTLIRRATGGYEVRTAGRLSYRFRDVGRPDHEHVLSSISNPSGHSLQLRYDERGRLAELVDTAGRVLELKSDADGRITAITAPHPDRPGERFTAVRYAYDERGNLIKVFDALRAPASYRYEGHLLTRETDRNGLSFHFEWDAPDETARCLRTFGDGGIYDHKLSYDQVHGITTVENSLGHKTQYEHRDGLVVRTVDAHGASSTTEYDEHLRKLKTVDPLGLVCEFGYDERGNRTAITTPDGVTQRQEYDARDLPLSKRDALGGIWRWNYDEAGRLIESVDPLDRSTRLDYAGGLVNSRRDPAGNATWLAYDGQHNLSAIQAPERGVRRFEYDGLGRMIAVFDGGSVSRREYDLLGRVVRTVDPDGSARVLEYDGEGNLVHAKDEQHDVYFLYQGLGKLTARIEAGTSVRFEYDPEEQLTGIVNELGHAYRFEFEPTGAVASERAFDGAVRSYRRDIAGRVVAVTSRSGATSAFEYDRVGRVVKVTHADGAEESYAYRADGELMRAQNATTTVAFERDALGRIVRELQGEHWIESEYDARGLRVGMRSSLGADQEVERDVAGAVVGLTHGAADGGEPFAARYVRDGFGLELESARPGGVRSRFERDILGRPVQHEIDGAQGALRAVRYDWDGDDRLRGAIDTLSGPVQYGHDALGQLAFARRADGTAELRVPDAAGNLFRREDRTDRTYGAAGQLLAATDEEGRVTHYGYDGDGQLIEKRREGEEPWRYRWNADGTLRAVERGGATLVSFAYDALGRRVARSGGGRTTQWVWDGEVPLHESTQRELATTTDEAITWLFEPETFVPLGKLTGQHTYSIVTDRVGTPAAMFDRAGAETWRADIGIWGELRAVEGDAAACPFRWPGQYEDAETGLRYNRFRYYDPEAGQYMSPDPIRIAGGLAFYGYVSDPLTLIDPLGLTTWCVSSQRWRDARGRYTTRPADPADLVVNGRIDYVSLMQWQRGLTDWNPANAGNQWSPSSSFPTGGFSHDLRHTTTSGSTTSTTRYRLHGHGRNPNPALPSTSHAAQGPTTTVSRSGGGQGHILTTDGRWVPKGPHDINDAHIPIDGSPY